MAKKPAAAKPPIPAKYRGLTETYARRLMRGEAQGKTRQEARGKTAREYEQRVTRKAIKEGRPPPLIKSRKPVPAAFRPPPPLSRGQRSAVTRFARRQVIRPEGLDDDEAQEFVAIVQAWAEDHGYPAFVRVRKTQQEMERDYLVDVREGGYVGRKGLLELLAGQNYVPDTRFYFYH